MKKIPVKTSFLCGVALIAGLMSGCGAKNSLDTGTAASLILGTEQEECGDGRSPLMRQLILAGPPHEYRTATGLALWWVANLEQSPKAKVISKGQGQFLYGTQEELMYSEGNHEIVVDAFTENDSVRTQAIIKLCAYEPVGVEVLDTTFDESGKLAHITYRLKTQLSPLGQQLSGGGIGSFAEPPPTEYRALLRRLDETGWRYERRE